MYAAAGLGDVLPRPLLLVGVLGAKEGAAGAGVELGQEVPDLGEILRRMALVDDVAQELPELVELEQAGGLTVERGQQAGAGRDAVAAEVALQARGNEGLFDGATGVVLAAGAAGHADHVEIGAQIGLGQVLAAHERAQRAEAGANGEDRLRPDRARQDVVDQQLARHDRQNRRAVVDQARPEARHVAVVGFRAWQAPALLTSRPHGGCRRSARRAPAGVGIDIEHCDPDPAQIADQPLLLESAGLEQALHAAALGGAPDPAELVPERPGRRCSILRTAGW
jgi:hypothetical protein